MWSEILPYLLPLGIALIPGLYAWKSGRDLVRGLEEPTFAERLVLVQRRRTQMTVCAVLVLVVFFSGGGFWVALALLGPMVGGFPSRQKIFDETWGLGRYLLHSCRFTLAFGGVWLILLLTPALLQRVGPYGWLLAAVIAAVVGLWQANGSRLFPWFMGATPLDQPKLVEAFERILAKACCQAPRLYRAGPEGGHFVNAFALPGLLHAPGVLFTNDLLKALETREAVAIFAHEVAHLEHFTRRRQIQNILRLLLIVGLCSILTLVVAPMLLSPAVIPWAWAFFFLFALGRSRARQKKHEDESDLRALELCEDPQALIDGLTKLHVLLRQPRRSGARAEEASSHPSLARRIQTIRAASGALPLPVEPIGVRDAGDPRRGVILGADHLVWLSGWEEDSEIDPLDPLGKAREVRSQPYNELRELRLVHRGSKPLLSAVDLGGRTSTLEVAEGDLSAIQTHLDQVDHLLYSGVEVETAPWTRRLDARFLASLGVVVSLMPNVPWALLPASILVLIRPARASLAAASLCAVGGGAFLLNRPSIPESFFYGLEPLFVVLQLAFGILLVAATVSRFRSQQPDATWVSVVTATSLLAVAAIGAIGGFYSGSNLLPNMQAHLWLRDAPSVPLALLGAAAALWVSGHRWAKALASVPLFLALGALLCGTTFFRENHTEDLFRRAPERLQYRPFPGQPVRSETLSRFSTAIRISPDGQWTAVRVEDDSYSSEDDSSFHLSHSGGESLEVEASDLRFLGGGRAVAFNFGDQSIDLRLLSLNGESAGEWRISLPFLGDPELGLDPLSEGWWVAGFGEGLSEIRRYSGRVGDLTVEEESWDLSEEAVHFPRSWHVGEGARMLIQYYVGDFNPVSEVVDVFLLESNWPVELLALGSQGSQPLGQSALFLECYSPDDTSAPLVCRVSDRETAALWSLPADPTHFEPLVSISGQNYEIAGMAAGRLLLYGYGSAYLIDLKTHESLRLLPGQNRLQDPKKAEEIYIQAAALAPNHLAILTNFEQELELQVYSLLDLGDNSLPTASLE